MKIAVTGKGGVGKTTISALMARRLAEKGYKVLAIDADADANFAAALGIDIKNHPIKPISEMNELVEEKMGTGDNQGKGLYTLNPFVGDIPERFSIHHKGVDFLAVGTVKTGGSGCYCADNKFLKRLLNHIVLKREETVIIDMEAGLEHLSRGTAEGIDVFIVVVEPGQRSLETAVNVQKMATDIGVNKVYAIANKVRNQEELKLIKTHLKDIEILSHIPYNPAISMADLQGASPADSTDDNIKETIDLIIEKCK
ncbi:Cobyrinic acid a,c-diamide synthase [Alkaliphilus metalliredigens QYMF]|uniref:Cobyrinic acid a,c-diamide synthase n=1 Tax=Alkaliphilus metalliredigens (strain QYMF) TaxID=293826 RepID=A6TUL4_ALKMQ|nr:AAA family ATPase [Alkaliphilus metalliredigens]ABR49882.1 Cobyrinic acid a,c-diamide synthase [Alkaliphilus metalliredigens QYMF]